MQSPITIRIRLHALCLGWYCLGQFGVLGYAAGHDNTISLSQVLHNTRDAFYRSPGWCDGCDLNKNGTVNIEDMAQWAQTWLLNRIP